MDESTRVLIAIGAATAANCAPAFEHYYELAQGEGLSNDQVQAAVDIGHQIEQGAQVCMKRTVRGMLSPGELDVAAPCDCGCQ